MYSKIFMPVLISAFIATASFGDEHKKLLALNSDLGYALDKSYYDAGTKVDTVIFDLKELKRQGKKLPENILTKALKASSFLRSKWLKIEQTRVSLWNNYSRANPASLKSMASDFRKLQQAIDEFSKSSAKLANKLNRETAALRKGIVYKFQKESPEWWSKNFIRGLDLSYKVYGVKRFKHAGNYMNMEYAAKACYDLGLNLLSLEVRQQHQDEMLKFFNNFCGTPFLLWGSDDFFKDRDCVSFKYYGDRVGLKSDVLKYIAKYKDYKFFAGIQLDEPIINDFSKPYGKLLNVAGMKDAYKTYIDKRKAYLENNGIKVPATPFTAPPKNPNQQALYMEWQMFKKQFMADHYKWFFEMMSAQGKFASTVVMNKNFSSPQQCSYVSMGHALPYLGTDIYQNGTTVESFAMQLLKNSASDRAIFWPGAGYSCKLPDTFRRTLATGLTHADGIHMWTYTFCSKYRDANYFWRYGGSRPNFDDKNRIALQNWYPWAWQIMKDMYQLAAQADRYLGKRQSIAQTAVVVSERTLIVNRLKRGQIRKYWENNLGIYCGLLKAGIPVDVCFIESMTPAKLNKYKVIIASDMTTITADETQRLVEWVKTGGTLISSGKIALYDEWGRKMKNFALSKVIGTDFKAISQGASRFKFSGIEISFPGFEDYVKTSPHQGTKCINWSMGSPALVLNRYGKGLSYYFTSSSLGDRIRTRYNGCGLGNRMFSGFDRLICKIIKNKTNLPIVTGGLPTGVEVQIQKNVKEEFIVNLVNWHDNRPISGHWLQINLPGNWKVIYPGSKNADAVTAGRKFNLTKFNIYQMVILQKEN
jgi:hypothetical protein